MRAMRLALTELRRLTSSRLGRLAVAAMLLVPTLYGGLYLYANKDPYASLDRVPAAIVVDDTGTTLSTGERLSVGDQVASSLIDAKSFDWRRVSQANAAHGLREGRYNFVVVIPRNFSADLASTAESTPRQALLELHTNDANGYLSRTIANQVVAQVSKSVASQVSSTTASKFLEGFSTIHTKVDQASEGADKVANGAKAAQGGAGQLVRGSDQLLAGERDLVAGTDALSAGATRLHSGLSMMQQQVANLPAQTRQLADGAQQVADGNAEVADAGRRVADATKQLSADLASAQGGLAQRLGQAGFTPEQVEKVLAQVQDLSAPVEAAKKRVDDTSSRLTRLSDGARAVAKGASQLADASGALTEGVNQAAAGSAHLADGASQLNFGQRAALDGATRLASGGRELEAGLGELTQGSQALAKGLSEGATSIPDPKEKQRRAMAETLGNPVGVRDLSQATASNYGAGLAPFFMSLALWIGGFVLFTRVRALSQRALAAGLPGWRVSLGGWAAPALLGLGQAVIAWLVILCVVGVDAKHPWLLLGFMACVSMTFMAIIHALMARFGLVGQFLGLILMVLQLVSAGGTFPWQTLPGPLVALHHVLPMSYAVDGLRRLMYGGSLAHLCADLTVLAAYALGAFVVAAVAARRSATWTAARIKPPVAPA